VAPIVDPAAFLVVAAVRRGLFYGACFELGRALGPEGLPWLERRAARFARFVRWLERLFARAPHGVVLLFTGPTVSGLAGIHGMSRLRFAALALPGLCARLAIVLWFGDALKEPIGDILAFIDRHWVSGTVVLVAVVAIRQWQQRRAWLRRRDV
jgi:membrane protein DedA with SNARE-associated domain